MPTEADALAAIMAAFPGAELLDERDTCPRCGRRTRPSTAGHRTYCRRCCYVELGTSELALSLAVETGKSIKVIEAKLERWGPPSVSPKEWTTPRSRLK